VAVVSSLTILVDKTKRYLANKNAASLRRLLARSNFADIVEMMETSLTVEEAVTCFQYLNMGQAAQVLNGLDDELQQACLSEMPAIMSGKILRTMPVDDAVDILQELDIAQSQKILQEMPMDVNTQTIRHLMLEEPDTAAGIMSTNFVKISVNATVADALQHVRDSHDHDFAYYVYLVDDDDELLGVVSLKSLVHHSPETPVNQIATFDVKSLMSSYDQELAANLFRKYYNLIAIPVVDDDNVLRGIITIDDVLDVIEEEVSEDLYRASGINLEQVDEKNLLTGPAINAVKARMPWLSITVFGQLLGSFIIASFAPTIQVAVIAVSFMPLLTGLAGNMGTQSDTIAVRGISQGLVTADNFKEKLWREVQVALLTGSFFALLVGFACFAIYRHLPLVVLLMGWIVISLITTAMTGICVPYFYHKWFQQDPAGVGGPFITTASDLLTFSVYLYIVTLLLPYMAL